jgi:hypothetical protein
VAVERVVQVVAVEVLVVIAQSLDLPLIPTQFIL